MKKISKIFIKISCLIFIFTTTCLHSSSCLNQLDSYLNKLGYHKIEGHCCASNTAQPEYLKKFISNPKIRLVAEIGFNAGHSSIIFLENNPNCVVYSFDIATHSYVDASKSFIDEKFPNRHHLIKGNSLFSIDTFADQHPKLKFDAIFIDGGHSFELAYHDMVSMKRLSHKNTLLLIDDLCIIGVKKAFDKCVKEGLITSKEIIKSKHKRWALCQYAKKKRNEPWLTELSIEFLKEFFKHNPNARVLEFGSGASTLWIAKRTSNLHSVEHSIKYFNYIKKELQKKDYNKVNYIFSALPYYHICDKFPDNFFDLIIVDGRNRKGCIAHSIHKLKSGGVLMLDNSERTYYHPVFSLMKGWEHVSTEQKGPDKFGFWYPGWKTDYWIKP